MLPKPVKTAVNRFAHAQGMKHAEVTKQRVLAALEALRQTEKMTPAELIARIEGIESNADAEPRIG